MKKLLIAVTCAASTAAFAQTQDFEGLSLGAAVELKSTTVKLSASGLEFSGLGKQEAVGAISADYGIPFGGNSVLLIGGKYSLGDTVIGELKGSGDSVKLVEKNSVSVFIAPGVVVTPKTLVYGKLSYNRAQGHVSDSAGGSSDKETITGMGFGAGIRTEVSKNVFLNVEAGRINYSKKDLSGLSATTGTTYGSVGFSFKF